MKIWVGLGNPGPSYAQNRHNIGFMAVDRIQDKYGFSAWKSNSQSASCKGVIAGQKITLLKPLTYMNKSGIAVAEMARFYKVEAPQIVVFHDEIDIAAGRLRVKQGGGHGGHNGLRDIDRHIPGDYWRVRMGVGRPEHKQDVHKWVLNDFSQADKKDWLERLIVALCDEAETLADADYARYASRIAYLAPAPKPQPSSQND